MPRFTCSRCGKCCQNFGPYLHIERELETGHYYCRCSLTGEYFFARIASDQERDLLKKPNGRQSSCPFLYQESPNTYTCAIYPSRPILCRDYRCSKMDILDSHGIRRGKVGGRRSLISVDQTLIAYWQKEILPLLEESDASWCEKTKGVLERGGYQVVLYE